MKTEVRAKLFQNNLTKIRTSRGMTQDELAKATLTAKSVISQMETGKLLPSMSMINLIAIKLKCTIYDLLT